MGGYVYRRQRVYNIQKIRGPEEKISQKVHRPQPVRNSPNTTATTKTKCTGIQEYATKSLTLAHQSQIGNQGTKALIFNRLLYKEQEYVMLANAQMTKEQLGKETVEEFLHRASMMLQKQEVRKGMYLAGGERHRMTHTKQAT